MTVQEYKLYKETGVIPWYKAGIIKRFWKTNPTYEQIDIITELVYSWALIAIVYLGIGIVGGFGLFLMLKNVI
jgi:hypothetical protein